MVQPPEEDYEPLRDHGPWTAERGRDVTRGFLAVVGLGDSGEAEAVLLVVSELVTNAVRHAGAMTGSNLVAGPGTATVCVEDASRIPPCPQPTEPGKPGGFGWHLVQELSIDVRVDARSCGETVSVILPLSRAPQ
ncbi:ATP-binding protein [Streptomyces sp. NPDC006356]